jgi:N-acetylmuramoyl-L-alanine amidase
MRSIESVPEPMRIPRSLFCAILGRKTKRMRTLVGAFVFLLAPGASTAVAQAPAEHAERFVIVLDAAHGGDDTGAGLGNEAEKNYTLAFSVKLRSLLVARGIAVVTTRESDATVDPDRRAQIANHANAQACLSLHATESGSGVHLFVSSQPPTAPALFLPWKTAQAAFIPRSLSLAGVLNSALIHAGIPVTLGRTALPAIGSMACPAVAVEIAPERSSDKSGATAAGPASLDNPDYEAEVANALAAAMVEWRSDDRGGK